ncbi:MAG: DUF3467 domain-containing protein [FCB group bacterium]|nr:DUF3467 domain-containing protein [FCB group bacterium]
MNQPGKQQIQVNLGEEVAEGVYANLAAITHSPSEMVIDFIRIMPGLPKAKVQSRVIMTPQNAKSFSKAIADNIEKFEEKFGEIKIASQDDQRHFGFNPSPEQS